MLQLKKIVKTYTAGDTKVQALRGIDLSFREHELVAILGPSGCGKTTLLNIIGGLDNYDSGDLIINGVSTKDYRDADWDIYRNHSIGFVFQSYNLIPHQTVLANVELALTLSGVSKAERRRRAIDALTAVGLGDQIKKKPNQMSGGQMQRVAIARALVNDPDILLADEPTGALDSETSVQLMEILKEISSRKLIIMVTHNPELAEKYATRTVRVLDGKIVDDTDPLPATETELRKPERIKKPSMSFFTALSLSLNNLMTKKGRTFLTSFAGSIGIIGIALILALSNGVQAYINRVQEDTLSSYPITIEAESVDMGSLISSFMGVREEADQQKTDEELGNNVYSSAVMYELMNALNSTEMTTNNLTDFKKYLETPNADGVRPLDELATSIKYTYDLDLNIYTKDTDGKVIKSDVTELMSKMMSSMYGESAAPMLESNPIMSSSAGFEIWEEMISSTEEDDEYLVSPLLREQYDVIYGDWPREYNEVVLVVDKNNSISDLVLYSLGLITADEIAETVKQSAEGNQVDTTVKSWSFEEICGLTLKYIPTVDLYGHDAITDTYTDLSATETGLSYLYNGAEELKIVGIIRGSKNAVSTMMSGSICYTSALTEHIISHIENSDIVKKQLSSPDVDVITGLPFPSDSDVEPTDAEKALAVKEVLAGAENSEKASVYTAIMAQPSEEYLNGALDGAMATMTREAVEQSLIAMYTEQMPTADVESVKQYIASMDDETLFGYVREAMKQQLTEEYATAMRAQLGAMTTDQLAAMYDSASFTDAQYASLYAEYVPNTVSDSTYDKILDTLGYVNIDSPDSLNIYAATFADKEKIADVIAGYNETVDEQDQISYVDYVEMLMSSVTTIINAISYVLMAFVSISLVVSSIMIGIITYISVLERTKEIGILRAIGASKRDVKRVFNAETMIVGFAAGAIGIIVTVLLCIPINIIIRALTGIPSLGAALPPIAAVILVAISVILTLIAGLVPSAVAAKKDPVIALRTE
ncbi:MAG: ABC transporter ATP-binding protein/permease [Clostridia bacterium]|nr:ABC transporter ATP-binding protein/permease [Clostridia bacterium]